MLLNLLQFRFQPNFRRLILLRLMRTFQSLRNLIFKVNPLVILRGFLLWVKRTTFGRSVSFIIILSDSGQHIRASDNHGHPFIPHGRGMVDAMELVFIRQGFAFHSLVDFLLRFVVLLVEVLVSAFVRTYKSCHFL